jgi:dephospho-CoA kinase
MIVGVTGTNGAGKGTVVQYLAGEGFKHYSARDFIVAEIGRRGLSVDRSSMREVANDLRKMHGPEYVIRSLYIQAEGAGGNAGLESIRTIGEVEFLRSKHAPLLAVDAERRLRYERVTMRGSATDKVDFDTWVAQEEREWNNTAAYDMNIPAVMAMADYTIQNDGTLEELHAQIRDVLAKMKE